MLADLRKFSDLQFKVHHLYLTSVALAMQKNPIFEKWKEKEGHGKEKVEEMETRNAVEIVARAKPVESWRSER